MNIDQCDSPRLSWSSAAVGHHAAASRPCQPWRSGGERLWLTATCLSPVL